MAITDVSRKITHINIDGAWKRGKGAYALIVYNEREIIATVSHYMGSVEKRELTDFAALMATFSYLRSVGSPSHGIAIIGDSPHVLWPFIYGPDFVDETYRAQYELAKKERDALRNLNFLIIQHTKNHEAHALAAKVLMDHV